MQEEEEQQQQQPLSKKLCISSLQATACAGGGAAAADGDATYTLQTQSPSQSIEEAKSVQEAEHSLPCKQ